MPNALEQAIEAVRRALGRADTEAQPVLRGWHELRGDDLRRVLHGAVAFAALQAKLRAAVGAAAADHPAEFLAAAVDSHALWAALTEERITLDVSCGTLVHEHGRLEDVVRWSAYDSDIGRRLAAECATARDAAMRALRQVQAERETAAQATAAEAARTTVYDEVPGV